MRKLLFAFLFVWTLPALRSLAQETPHVKWMTLEEAQAAQAKAPRKILIDVYTKWCGPCKMMLANTFSNPKIIEYINAHYYPVKFNAEGNTTTTFKSRTYTNPGYNPASHGRNATHQLTYQIANVNGRVAYPTIVYMDEDLNIIQAIQGYQPPAQIEPILHFFAEDYYKTTPYTEFQKGFKSSFVQ